MRLKIKILAADVESREENSLSYLQPDPAVINMLHEILPEKKKKKKGKEGPSSRGQTRKILSSCPPTDTPKLQLHIEELFLSDLMTSKIDFLQLRM